jgi:hypothetical protein
MCAFFEGNDNRQGGQMSDLYGSLLVFIRWHENCSINRKSLFPPPHLQLQSFPMCLTIVEMAVDEQSPLLVNPGYDVESTKESPYPSLGKLAIGVLLLGCLRWDHGAPSIGWICY